MREGQSESKLYSNWLWETKAHSTLLIEIALESRAGECYSKY